MRRVLEGSQAVAEAVRLARVQVPYMQSLIGTDGGNAVTGRREGDRSYLVRVLAEYTRCA